MKEKEYQNKGHFQVFLLGIFHARRYEIKGKIPELARVRLALSGSSTHVVTVVKQGNPLFNKRQTARVEYPETSSGMPNFITSFFCPPCGESGTKCRKGVVKQGFTLIELLVVVLIIGILAAVALPQYQLAVAKARSTEALNGISAIKTAVNEYILANNAFPTSYDQLSITLPGKMYKYAVNNDEMRTKHFRFILTNNRLDVTGLGNEPNFIWLSAYDTMLADIVGESRIFCYYHTGSSAEVFRDKVCRTLSSGEKQQKGNAVFYAI